MQIVGVGFYLVAVLPKLEDPSWLLTVRQNFILTCALLVISITSFWACAVTDPGILPPLSSPMKPPVPTDVHVGGPLGHRYCSTCNIFRPPRSKHCSCVQCLRFPSSISKCSRSIVAENLCKLLPLTLFGSAIALGLGIV
jgi:hypothetical protein